MNNLTVFILGMLAGGILQAFTEGILEALNSNKAYRCEGPDCEEVAFPDHRIRYRKADGKWHTFHSSECANSWLEKNL